MPASALLGAFKEMTGPVSAESVGNVGTIDNSRAPGVRVGTPYTIKLKIGWFDPLVDDIPAPPELRLTEPNGYYLVQIYTDGIDAQEKVNVIRRLGGEVLEYIPEKTYVVFMSADVKAEVEKLPFVRWIGNYEPAYKIDPRLFDVNGEVSVFVKLWKHKIDEGLNLGFDELEKIKPASVKNGKIKIGNRECKWGGVMLMTPDGPLRPIRGPNLMGIKKMLIEEQVKTMGGKVFESPLFMGRNDVMAVSIDASMIPNMAFMAEVEYIQPYTELVPMTSMLVFRGEHGIRSISNWEGNGNVPDAYSSTLGKFLVVSHFDDGHYTNHQEFQEYKGAPNAIVEYYGTPSGSDEHGTQTLSVLLARGVDMDATGIARNATAVVGDYNQVNWYDLLGYGWNTYNANVFSCSMGTSDMDGSYTTVSKDVDTYALNYPYVLQFWSLGNQNQSGTSGYQPTQQSTAKNCVGVGGFDDKGTADRSDDEADAY
ncbi:MAG: hypothetical protein DRN20_00930, partial [Thermoplasmata archaeon]